MQPVATKRIRYDCDDNDNDVKGSHNNDKSRSSPHVLSYIAGKSKVAAAVKFISV